MSDSRLREILESGDFIAAPGIHDMISALVANKLSVEVIYGSGYWLTAVKAGADIIFIELLSDEAEMRRACSAIDLPMMFNMNDRGSATNFSTEELRQIGCRISLWPSFLPLSMIHCLETSLEQETAVPM